MPTFVPPFAVQSGEGLTVETPTGDSVTLKADTGRTNGSPTVLELLIGPKQGPALHTHLREDELWCIFRDVMQPVRDQLAAVGHANWLEFVGPPVGVSDPL